MPDTPPVQSSDLDQASQRDLEHLRILSILHYVFGGLTLLGLCGTCIYLVFGLVILIAGPENLPDVKEDEAAAVQAMGAFFLVLGGCLSILMLGWGIATIMAGRRLQAHSNLTFCYIVAVVNCLSVPLGTTLSIFTFIVLARPSVRRLFEQQQARDSHGP